MAELWEGELADVFAGTTLVAHNATAAATVISLALAEYDKAA